MLPPTWLRLRKPVAIAGNVEKGVEAALDIEQPVYEAGRLLDAASLINRLANE